MSFIDLNKVETLPDLVGNHQQAWRIMGACGQSDPDLAFRGDANKEYEGEELARRATKDLCASCPVRQQCLDHAMVNDERFGIWGGLTTRQRDRYRAEWLKARGKDAVRQLRRTYGLSQLDAGVLGRYEDRLARARKAQSLLKESDLEGYEEHAEVLDLLVNHPQTSCTVLALRMGKGRFAFEQRFREICEVLHV